MFIILATDAFEVSSYNKQFCFDGEIGNFLSLHQHSPLRKTQAAASSPNEH